MWTDLWLQGEVVHILLGPRYRNTLTRAVFAIPRLFRLSTPTWLTIRSESIADVKVRVYYPKKRRSNAMILYFHGGGWSTLKPGSSLPPQIHLIPKKRKIYKFLELLKCSSLNFWITKAEAFSVDYDDLMMYFINRLGMLIISVDYRLSPEYLHPAQIDDCEAVYRELVTIDYKRYGIEPMQIFVMGDSAGGNLAAVLSQRQLRANFPKPKVCMP